MSYTPIEKNIEPSLNKIFELFHPLSLTVNVPGHHLHGKVFEITKGKGQYGFTSRSPILRGVQTHKEIQFESDNIVEFIKPSLSLFASGKYILVNEISYDGEPLEKVFAGSISSFSTCHNLSDLDQKFHRFIIPVGKKAPFDLYSFQKQHFITPTKRSPYYIPLNISGEAYHLFSYKLGTDYYLIIDGIQRSPIIQFQKKCFNALLTLGFINGNFIHDECFILSFEAEKMDSPENILYHSTRASVITNQATFTADPYSISFDVDFEREENGEIKKEVREKLFEGIQAFPIDVFSKMCSVFFEKEKLQRAALIFLQSHISALEIKIPNYYVAIEAISGYIASELATEKKSLSPIKDNAIANEIIESFKKQVQKIKTEKALKDDEFNLDILEKNINKLNAPPNADKLSESFTFFTYTLSAEQKKILNERNTFLHGSFLKTVGDNKQFREAFHVALRLHFMIAFLILKISGYSGKIINYAELWAHITGKKLGEERLVKI